MTTRRAHTWKKTSGQRTNCRIVVDWAEIIQNTAAYSLTFLFALMVHYWFKIHQREPGILLLTLMITVVYLLVSIVFACLFPVCAG